MRKHIIIGLLALASSYSVNALAGTVNPPPPPPPPPVNNIGPSALGVDNFTFGSNVGGNPEAGGRGPGSLAYALAKIFFGGDDLYFDTNGLLVTPDGKPFTGTTLTGQVFKDGKKV